MTYRTIEHQVGICHANLIDLQLYLQMIRPGEVTESEHGKIKGLLAFLRKHLNKPLLLPAKS